MALHLLVQEQSQEGNFSQLPFIERDNKKGEQLTFVWVRHTPAFLLPFTAFVADWHSDTNLALSALNSQQWLQCRAAAQHLSSRARRALFPPGFQRTYCVCSVDSPSYLSLKGAIQVYHCTSDRNSYLWCPSTNQVSCAITSSLPSMTANFTSRKPRMCWAEWQVAFHYIKYIPFSPLAVVSGLFFCTKKIYTRFVNAVTGGLLMGSSVSWRCWSPPIK